MKSLKKQGRGAWDDHGMIVVIVIPARTTLNHKPAGQTLISMLIAVLRMLKIVQLKSKLRIWSRTHENRRTPNSEVWRNTTGRCCRSGSGQCTFQPSSFVQYNTCSETELYSPNSRLQSRLTRHGYERQICPSPQVATVRLQRLLKSLSWNDAVHEDDDDDDDGDDRKKLVFY
jgi:hypothetical protein